MAGVTNMSTWCRPPFRLAAGAAGGAAACRASAGQGRRGGVRSTCPRQRVYRMACEIAPKYQQACARLALFAALGRVCANRGLPLAKPLDLNGIRSPTGLNELGKWI